MEELHDIHQKKGQDRPGLSNNPSEIRPPAFSKRDSDYAQRILRGSPLHRHPQTADMSGTPPTHGSLLVGSLDSRVMI